PYPRVYIVAAGLASIAIGARLRSTRRAEAPDYAPRLDPITGWSWGAMVGVVVLFLLVVFHRGPEDDLRQVAAAIAFACFAARSAIARRQGARLMADLRVAEGRFRTLVEQIPLAIYTDALDATSTTQYISPAIEQLVGFTPE